MLRSFLEGFDFNTHASFCINQHLENVVDTIVKTINANAKPENKVEVELGGANISTVQTIVANGDPMEKTPVQQAAEQLARQQGIEVNPLYFNDVDIRGVSNNLLLGITCQYPIRNVIGTLKGIISVVVYHPESGRLNTDNTGIKFQLFLSNDNRVAKQSTLVLIGNYKQIFMELSNKMSLFVINNMKELEDVKKESK